MNAKIFTAAELEARRQSEHSTDVGCYEMCAYRGVVFRNAKSPKCVIEYS